MSLLRNGRVIRFHIKELIAEKEFNEGRRITLDEISEATGIHRTTLSLMSNRKGYSARTDSIEKLCEFFDVSVDRVISYVK